MPSIVQDVRDAFRARIRALRKAARLSQYELAARARLDSSYISALERGLQSPTLDVLNRLARGFDITIAELCSPLNRRYRLTFKKARAKKPRRRSSSPKPSPQTEA